MCIPSFKGTHESFEEITECDDLDVDVYVDRTGAWDQDIDISSVEDKITEDAKEFAKRKLGLDFQECLEEAELQGVIHAIISLTGDDEIIATDAAVIGILHFVCAKEISGIQLAEKDTNISNRKGNYAEGWVILPPNREASIDTVNRRHKNAGIPLVMDPLKLKQSSAVRKQSALETDFESKYSDLYNSVSWTDKHWLTYDYGQMMLIFATCIFDFKESKTNPYLYKSEGGCGGAPPWENLDTAFAGTEHFSNGRSTQSTLYIMSEATSIQRNRMKPKDAKFINASHYAQRGDSSLGKLLNLDDKLKTYMKEDKLHLLECVRDNNPVPNELLEKSIVVEPSDRLLGCAISELRKNGLIMTELDLQNQIAKQRKYNGLLGDKNMGMLIQEQKEEMRKSRKNAYRILASMGTSRDVPKILSHKYIMRDYYKLRNDFSDITAFNYAGIIRIFKASDVLEHYETYEAGIRDEILATLPAAKNYRLSQKTSADKEKVEFQINWMNEGPITEIFDGEIPPGVGSDDARITRKISMQLKNLNEDTVFVVFTDDSGLIQKLEMLVHKHPFAYILQIPKRDYIKGCLLNTRNSTEDSDVLLFNYVTQTETYFCDIGKSIRTSGNWNRVPYFQKIWDFPNYNRGLEPIEFSKATKTYKTFTGGFLRKRTIERNPHWAQIPWKEFKNLDDFKISHDVRRINRNWLKHRSRARGPSF